MTSGEPPHGDMVVRGYPFEALGRSDLDVGRVGLCKNCEDHTNSDAVQRSRTQHHVATLWWIKCILQSNW